MKVLMSAYACEPGRGSEPGAGWAWACAATRDHEVWVLTHATNAASIDAALAADHRLANRLHPVYLQNARWARSLRRHGPTRFLYYVLWQLIRCRREARKLHDLVGFDVCHHVTYGSDWLPAGVSAIQGVPFVWGPVGGSATTGGARLWAKLGGRALVVEALRAVVLGSARQLIGRPLARRAVTVLGQNSDVVAAFAPVPVTVQPHVALDINTEGQNGRAERGSSRTAVYAGRLLAWKGLRLALAALRRPEASGWRLEVYGSGPERCRLEQLVGRWKLSDQVQFHGSRPRRDVLTALLSADVLMFPSLHDSAGWSVAEAMALGCPVLCLDTGGPPTLVGVEDGVVVPLSGDVVGGLASGLDQARELRPRREQWSARRLPDLLDKLYSGLDPARSRVEAS
jgi:glycosyltransferase involved in cell wall biosynthesis